MHFSIKEPITNISRIWRLYIHIKKNLNVTFLSKENHEDGTLIPVYLSGLLVPNIYICFFESEGLYIFSSGL